jgi:glycopeptide antibiotics resistance protein
VHAIVGLELEAAIARVPLPSTGIRASTVAESATKVLLFVSFGAALAVHGFSTTKTVLCGLLVSTLVEGAQLLYCGRRTTSLDDVFLNSVGAGVGAELVWSLHKRLGRRDEARLPQAV